MVSTRKVLGVNPPSPPLISAEPPRKNTGASTPLAPKAEALRRESLPPVGRARRGEKTIALGLACEKQRPITLSKLTGELSIGGAASFDKKSREALAIYGAAELLVAGTEVPLSEKTV